MSTNTARTLITIFVLLAPTVALAQPSAAMATELAGEPLEDYPQFRYVAAYNEDTTIYAALDPGVYPAIQGKTCDVWVVPSLTDDEWDAWADTGLHLSTSLVDARSVCPSNPYCTPSSPPCRCYFRADAQCPGRECGISDQTISLAVPNDLSSTPATPIGLGAGYDVVLDCGAGPLDLPDGTLGAHDFIDGYGEEAGLYVVHDTTEAGIAIIDWSYELSQNYYPDWKHPHDILGQRITYPSGLDQMDPRPLVIISHGYGQNYGWYGWLQRHLASYGYIVVSVQLKGVAKDRAEYILNHLGAFLTLTSGTTDQCRSGFDYSGDICDDVVGRVDTERIVLIGHSRGGEASILAYDLLADEEFDPDFATLDASDIALIVGMAPSDHREGDIADPREVPFHMFYGSADAEGVAGDAFSPHTWSFTLLERAQGARHATYIHGVGHGWFHDRCCPSVCSPGDPDCCDPPEWCDYADGGGADLLSEGLAHRIVKGIALPLLKHYTDGNVPGRDFLSRRWRNFRPAGVIEEVEIAQEYRPPRDARVTIDDYQEAPNYLAMSSSLGSTTYTVDHVFEGLMVDEDCSFEWISDDEYCSGVQVNEEPMNGMTRSHDYDDHRCVVFDWGGGAALSPQTYTWSIESVGLRDFFADPDYVYLSFRAAQGTRHPLTLADDGTRDFTVRLQDVSGTTSSIRVGEYSAGLIWPYPRQSGQILANDPGWGWQNAFDTVRIRLTDFLNNRSGLDLANIDKVTFEFGGTVGSPFGRIAIDDLELTME